MYPSEIPGCCSYSIRPSSSYKRSPASLSSLIFSMSSISIKRLLVKLKSIFDAPVSANGNCSFGRKNPTPGS